MSEPAQFDGTDPYAPWKDRAWRELRALDERLERGEISEADWYAEIGRLLVPAYLAADTPWGGSGKSGTAADWEYSRSHVADAVDRKGSFLDVGCANGYLLECLPRWTSHPLERFGLDIAPELVEVARADYPTSLIGCSSVMRSDGSHRTGSHMSGRGSSTCRGGADANSSSGCSGTAIG